MRAISAILFVNNRHLNLSAEQLVVCYFGKLHANLWQPLANSRLKDSHLKKHGVGSTILWTYCRL